MRVVDRTGQRFGRLVAISRDARRGKQAYWLCQCDCGRRKVIGSNPLRCGRTISCGCFKNRGPRKMYKCHLPQGQSALNALLNSYSGAAKGRGLEWGLSREQFDEMVGGACFYCGQPPSLIKKVSRNGHILRNGLDRVDNAIGYTTDNVVTCCHVCNHAKHTMSSDDFVAWIKRAAAHLHSLASQEEMVA